MFYERHMNNLLTMVPDPGYVLFLWSWPSCLANKSAFFRAANMQFHCIYQHISYQIIASRYMSYTMVLIMRVTRVREQ